MNKEKQVITKGMKNISIEKRSQKYGTDKNRILS
jgi:hypothetical protein